MSAPHHANRPTAPRPTVKRLQLLRRLALERGESFAMPQTRAQASREIARLKARQRSTRTERAVERRQVSRDLGASGDAARVRDSEITGYGASASWRRNETQ
jgi:hypothetical protein